MSAFTTWVVSGWVHLAIGIAIGWVIFKRPQWFQNLIDKAKAKIESVI